MQLVDALQGKAGVAGRRQPTRLPVSAANRAKQSLTILEYAVTSFSGFKWAFLIVVVDSLKLH